MLEHSPNPARIWQEHPTTRSQNDGQQRKTLTTNTTRTITARWVTGVAISAGLALALGTGGLAASASSTPAPVRTNPASCSFAQHLLSVWRAAPADLRADLKAAKAVKPGTERRAALKKIADSAVAGTYGTTVEAFAKAVKASPAWKSCTPSGS